jgi:hypothetical protein
MNTELKIGRREFLKVSASAGASLVIGFYLSACKRAPTPVPEPAASPTAPPKPTASSTATAEAVPSPTAVPEPTAAPTAIPEAAEPFAPFYGLIPTASSRSLCIAPKWGRVCARRCR